MDYCSTILIFMGGLGMFLYGMNRMAEGMQKLTGTFIKNFLEVLSDKKVMAMLVGVLITAIIQSSTGTTIMVIGFVNAGILSLVQSVGIIMGANIGTTVTGWIVSLISLGNITYPYVVASFLVGCAAFMMVLLKNEKRKVLADVVFGVGILFVGLYTMTNAINQFENQDKLIRGFAFLGDNPILAILAGILITVILQS